MSRRRLAGPRGARALAALVLLAPLSCAADLDGPETAAGAHGCSAVSEVEYSSSPGRAHRLEVTYLFPDRARWSLEAPNARSGERLLVYRHGERFFHVPAGSGESQVYEPAYRGYAHLQVELRRAALVWPGGFEWSGEGAERSAAVPGAGRLVATLGVDGLPERLASFTIDETPFEVYADLRWSEPDARGGRHPVALTLSVSGREVWRERVLAVDRRGRFVDSYFLPPDRRRLDAARDVRVEGVRHVDLPARVQRRVPLEPGLGWEEARKACEALRRDAAAKLASGWELEQDPTIEVAADARPAACLLRLVPRPGEEPPEGYSEEPAGVGLALELGRPAGLSAALLGRLAAGLPEGTEAGPAHVRLRSSGARVVQPARATDG